MCINQLIAHNKAAKTRQRNIHFSSEILNILASQVSRKCTCTKAPISALVRLGHSFAHGPETDINAS